MVQLLPMSLAQTCCERGIKGSIAACHGFCANPIDHSDRWQQDSTAAECLNQRLGYHDAFIGLLCQGYQRLHRRIVTSHCKGPQAKHRLQFNQMCSARLCPLPVLSPNVERSFKLGCHEAQHRRKRGLFYLQHPAWGAHVTQLDCKSQLSGSLATLANDRQIRLAERVMPNQGILMFRQRSQTLAFRCRQHPTTRHGCLSTFVSDSLPYPAAVPHKILTFVFLNITLESLFSILSPFHGFQESFGSLMLIGYARVSTQDQNLTLQKDALRRRAARKSLKTRRAQGIQRVPGGLKRLRCCAQKIHGWSSGSWIA